jgi:hypothetical protein
MNVADLVSSSMLLGALLLSQPFEGLFRGELHGRPLTLELSTDGDRVGGALTIYGSRLGVVGKIASRRLTGWIEAPERNLSFTASARRDEIVLELDGGAEIERIVLRRCGPVDHRGVVINGRLLTEAEIEELAIAYGVRPRHGRYWYDAKSGLYGAAGFAAFGFMRAGHAFGKLERSASSGDTGVVINGREIPKSEWIIWTQMLGGPVDAGSYWLDDEGNVGYEGGAESVANLFEAAKRRRYSGIGHDGFWSSRFSSTGERTVTAPGYGPVSHGF